MRAGELIGGTYRVVAPLGKGGMGTVLRCFDLGTNRVVAVKVMHSDQVTPTRLERFLREAQLLASLDKQAGLVRVYAAGEHQGAPFMAMELVEGTDLDARLERERTLPVDEALALLEPIARAVGACHAAGVTHRDLKPGNILLGPQGPKVADFGLARAADQDRLTRTGELVGTPAYMPPEQLAGLPVDARADVWALGAILYRALTGRTPVEGTNLLELAARSSDRVEPPSRTRPEVPPDLDAVVLRALAPEAAGRYPDAAALADDLARLRRRERPSASTQASGVERVLEGARRPWGMALLASLLGVSLGAAILLGQERAGRATLRACLEWDGARCALDPTACAGGAHVVASWDLGLGDGPAPALDEVDRQLAALAGVDAEGASAQVARLRAVRARLAPDDRAARAASAPGLALVLDALDARARGDVDGALERIERALAREPELSTARRLRARLWEDRLAASGSPALALQLVAFARDPRRDALELAETRDAAERGLAAWTLATLRRAPALEAARLGDELEAAAGAARALERHDEVRARVARDKAAALEGEAVAWAAAFDQARDPVADEGRIACLGLALSSAPATPLGPALRAVLERALARRAERATSTDALARAARFDALVLHRLADDWVTPPAVGTAASLDLGPLNREVHPELALAAMRTATRRDGDFDALVRLAGHERILALLAERPRSLALRTVRLQRARAQAIAAPATQALADALFEGAVIDLAPVYRATAFIERASVRKVRLHQLDAQPGPRSPAIAPLVQELRDDLRAFRRLADPRISDPLKDAWHVEALVAKVLGPDEALACWRDAAAEFRGRFARLQANPDGDYNMSNERRELAKILMLGVNEADLRDRELALVWAREAHAAVKGSENDGALAFAVSYLAMRAREEGKLDEAEALLAECPRGWSETPVWSREASRLAIARGDSDLLARRLREGLAAWPGDAELLELSR